MSLLHGSMARSGYGNNLDNLRKKGKINWLNFSVRGREITLIGDNRSLGMKAKSGAPLKRADLANTKNGVCNIFI